MTHSGWRKPTPGLEIAARLAQAGEQLSSSRSDCIVATKRVGVHIGLKPSDMMLLDTLAAFTQAQDWEEGQRPIVWASNAYLMEQTGFSLSALKRHVRRLAEAGVISFKDSPNGKRWGHRDERGRIIEAYGFDLSPMSARHAEFADLHAALQAERAECQHLRRQVTITRRMIRARLEEAAGQGLSGSWGRFADRFQELLTSLPRPGVSSERLLVVLESFRALLECVENAFMQACGVDEVVEKLEPNKANIQENAKELNPREVISEPHIRITKESNPVTRNSSENEKHVEIERLDPPTETGLETIEIATVMQACPEFTGWVRDLGIFVRDWGDLNRAAGRLGPMIGVSDSSWKEAQMSLGPRQAAVSMALIFDKFNAGEVSSPGGYLRGMVARAGAGELHLERSLYGRLGPQAA
ncbi:MAG: hypothetical protein JXQ97_15760 [Natronospirillum sp.]